MHAETYDPMQLSLTARAQAHVQQQLAKEDAHALVLGITETGCNGYMYELDFLRDQHDMPDGRTFQFGEGVTIFVSNADWEMLRGTQIDYVTEGLNSSLKFKNPNADTLCGCGESFSVRGT